MRIVGDFGGWMEREKVDWLEGLSVGLVGFGFWISKVSILICLGAFRRRFLCLVHLIVYKLQD